MYRKYVNLLNIGPFFLFEHFFIFFSTEVIHRRNLKIILVIFYKCDLNLKNFSKGGMELVLNNDELIFPYNDKEIVSFVPNRHRHLQPVFWLFF
jgi:hypothetical protein